MISMFAAAALFQSQPYAHVGQWAIFENSDNCAMLANYERGSGIWISYEFGQNRVKIVITDPSFKSVTDDKEYSLKLIFKKPNKFDDGWGSVNAKGLVLDDGSRGIRISLNAEDALADIAASDLIALMNDDVIVSSLSLTGSAVAVAKLRQCALMVHRKNPSDPLLGAEKPKRN